MNGPTVYEGWWEVPDGLLLASQLAAMDLPRIPGGEVAGIVQAENWHARGRDDQFRLYRLSDSLPSTASATQLEAADAKRTKNRVYRCEECGAFSEQALPRYPLDDQLLKNIEPRYLCRCCRHITRLTGYQAHHGARRAAAARWAATMAAAGAALAVTAAEVRPEGTTPSGKRHPITGIAVLAFDIADGRKVFDATVLRRPAKAGQRTKEQLDPEPGAKRLRAAIEGRSLIGWTLKDLEPLRPILAPNSGRHVALGEEAHARVTDWRSDIDVRTGRPRAATNPGRPDRLALLIRRIATTTPAGSGPRNQEEADR
ncbi:hypothetical protein [Catenulispora rubra]|uniref:hypothetical protein n=1 Tax=Catenulispora rubra TaxID=280293 RepID=UPI001892873D|nr:hypothetical protein [Catenulispora rubra]